jgi:hypothetical protein
LTLDTGSFGRSVAAKTMWRERSVSVVFALSCTSFAASGDCAAGVGAAEDVPEAAVVAEDDDEDVDVLEPPQPVRTVANKDAATKTTKAANGAGRRRRRAEDGAYDLSSFIVNLC